MLNFYLNAQRSFLGSLILSACLLLGVQMSDAQIIIRDTFLVGGSYTVPAGVTTITVQAWGGGGGGGRGNNRSYAAAGGGGGAYAESTLTGVSGTYTVTVGQGGQGGTQLTLGNNGTASVFGSNLVVAPGGSTPNDPSGGPYGLIPGLGGSGGTGDVTYAGGDGAALVNNTTGGGAGSSAGSATNGNDANGQIGGAAPANGGKGGNGGSNAQPGLPGLFPGGGGGGKGGGQNVSSGNGADGMVIVSYTIPPVTLDCPGNDGIMACSDQDAVNAAFNAWLADFGFSGGCETPSGSFDAPTPTAPDACGGSTTVTYRVVSECEDDKVCTHTFTVDDEPLLEVSCPLPAENPACDNQTAVDAAFATWLGEFDYEGGCGTVEDGITGLMAPSFCGGSIEVNYEVSDNCGQTAGCVVTFSVEYPDDLVATCPDPVTVDACSTAGEIATKFTEWLGGFSYEGGCTVVESGLNGLTAPTTCGGVESATYMVSDNCTQSDQCTSTFTVEEADDLVATCPQNVTHPICSTQDEVDAAFTTWLNGFSYEGGCEVDEDGLSSLTAPSFCGGNVSATYMVSDNCGQTDACSATFSVTNRANLSVSCPSNVTFTACSDQDDIDAAYEEWIEDFNYTGGCDVTPFDLTGYVAPSFCGGVETITYIITDACGQSQSCSSTFMVNEPAALNVTCPPVKEVNACLTQEQIDEEFYENFINLFTYTGGCVSETPTFDEEDIFENITRCGGTTVVTYRVTQDCGADATCSSTFIVEDAPELSTTCPTDETVNACSDQATVDAAFATWLNSFNYEGGCDTEVTSVTELTAPDACGGEVSVTYIATDACNQSSSCMSTFSVTPATTLAVTCPENITIDACSDQFEIDEAFVNWIAEFNTVGGCNTISTDISGLLSPLFCVGSETVTYVATDDCFGSSQCVASFEVTTAPTLSVTCPEPVEMPLCSTQEAIDAAFEEWIDGFVTVGGCNTISTDLTGYASPSFCGDIEPVVYTASQSCGPDQTCSSTFTVIEANEIEFNCPNDVTVDACTSQEDVDDEFAEWLSDFGFLGGCNVEESFSETVIDFTGVFAPSEWTFEDNGGDGSYDFIGVNGLKLEGSDASDVPFQETNTTLCTEITAEGEMNFSWIYVTEDESAEFDPFGYYINGVFTSVVDINGPLFQTGSTAIALEAGDEFCFAVNSTDDFAGRGGVFINTFSYVSEGGLEAPSSCGGSKTISFTVTSACADPFVCTKTFTVLPATTLVVNCPTSFTTDACLSLEDAEDAFEDWLDGFNTTGGCETTSEGLANATLPAICGGSTTINFSASDLCDQSGSCSATFTIPNAPEVTYSNPSDETVTACSFADQDELDADFAAWVAAQTIVIDVDGGCEPMISNDSEDQDIPVLCEGGSAMVTWTITDACFTTSVSAVYTLNTLNTVGVSQPSNTSVSSCLYEDQSDVQAAFNAWVAEQTEDIDPTGGCNPQISNNSAGVTVPSLCSGGSATVVWTVTDLCFSTTVSATFTLTAPSAVTFDAPAGTSSSACDYEDQAAINTAYAAWVAAQTAAFNVSGGCDPEITNNANSQTVPAFCAGGSATVTWTVSDLCFFSSVTATFTVTPVSGLAFSSIPDATLSADCSDVPAAATITASNNCGLVQVDYNQTRQDGNCDGNYTLTRTWTATDCSGTITAVQVVTVSDVTGPMLTGTLPGGDQPNVEKDDAPAAPSVATIAALYTDNCSDVVVTLVNSSVTGTDCIWTATYTYTVADECGNTASNAVVIYNGIDTQAPVIESCEDVLEVSVVGECFANVTIDTPEFEDNCDASITGVRSDNLALNAAYPVGTTTITWTVVDEGGNTDVCVQTVEVVDAQLINISGQGVDIENGATIPNVQDGTKFGSVSLFGSITKTFTIENIGCNVLNLTGSPMVTLSGAGSSFFTVISQPAVSSLAPGASTTFQVRYTGTSYGVHNAIVSIENSDMFNDPYTFAISAATSPAIIRISGNNITIPNGDNTPRTADFTDFAVNTFNSTRTRTFRVHNDGVSTLNLTGNPRVALSGPGASKFTVTTQPQATVSPGANRLFQITFTANEVGVFNATVTIESSDLGASPYTFDIVATVLPPSMQVRGNNIVIANGDDSPQVSDNTDFGARLVGSTTNHTFSVNNTGAGHLFLSGSPRVQISGADASQFVVTAQPVALIAPSSSSIFRISYVPTAMGNHSALVTIYNNDSDNDPYEFTIGGSAALPFKVGDIFEAPGISDDKLLTSAKLYPNPAMEVIFAELPILPEVYTVDFIGIDGRVVHTLQTLGGRIEVNVSSWTPGVYMMRSNVAGIAPIRFVRAK